MKSSHRIPRAGIDPNALLAIRDLELRARVAVQGMWSGLHRSPRRGFSSEFSEYRQYSQGDDLRRLDWRALARTDREYIKVHEDETNLNCLIVLDASKSMSFASGAHSKFDYAKTLAATLARFLEQQRDVFGLARFDEDINGYLQARWRPGHFKRLLALLAQPATGRSTRLATALDSVARLFRKQGLIVVLSDLQEAPEQWSGALSRLTAKRHDLRVVQILDPAEVSLEFGRSGEWEDIETSSVLYVDPQTEGPAYRRRIQERLAATKLACESAGASFVAIETNQPLDRALLALIRAPRRRSIGTGGLRR